MADEVRRAVVPDPQVVTWQIDRNVNITNVCISGCKFCNFHCKPHQTDRAFITTMEQYCEKNRPHAPSGRRPAAVAGRPAPRTENRLLRTAVQRVEIALPFAAAACAGRARSGAYRPHKRADDARNPAPPDGRGTGFAAGRRSRDTRFRRAPGHLPRQTLGREVARRDARSPLPESADLGDDDVRARRDAAPAHRPPVAHPRPADPLSRRQLRLHRLHSVDFPFDGHRAGTAGRGNPLFAARIPAHHRREPADAAQYPQHSGFVAHRGQSHGAGGPCTAGPTTWGRS